MTKVTRLGYIALGVNDLVEAAEFYSRFVRLDLTEQVGNTAFMTGGVEHHWIRLEEGNGSGLKRIGYEVADEAAVTEIRQQLKDRSIDFVEGGDLRKDRVQRWLRFVDPGGFTVEVYTGMVERGVAPINNGVKLEKFLHAAWGLRDWEQAITFYQEVLGFKPSDWIGNRAGFFRSADRYHHSLVLLRSEAPSFNHFCIQVESLDDVMRARNNALRWGVELRDDLLRHAPSGSIGVYLKDQVRGFAVEFCVGHPQLDDATHQARILPASPETRDVWLAPLGNPLEPGSVTSGPRRDAADSEREWIPGSIVDPIGSGRSQAATA
jgi:catechol 2,3-dioxygenase-like lactoylglutathione lyase family enzyme